MKRILLNLTIFVMLFAFSSCGQPSQEEEITMTTFSGEWNNVDIIMEEASYFEALGSESWANFTLNEDGTGNINVLGVVYDLTWTFTPLTANEENMKYIISIDYGLDKLELEYEQEKLYLNSGDSNKMVFERITIEKK